MRRMRRLVASASSPEVSSSTVASYTQLQKAACARKAETEAAVGAEHDADARANPRPLPQARLLPLKGRSCIFTRVPRLSSGTGSAFGGKSARVRRERARNGRTDVLQAALPDAVTSGPTDERQEGEARSTRATSKVSSPFLLSKFAPYCQSRCLTNQLGPQRSTGPCFPLPSQSVLRRA